MINNFELVPEADEISMCVCLLHCSKQRLGRLMQTTVYNRCLGNRCVRRFHSSRLLLKDYYVILGINKDASSKQIRNAYLSLCKQFHPDVHPQQPSATTRFQEINEAYSVLSDIRRRREYDWFQRNPMKSKREQFYRQDVNFHRPYEDHFRSKHDFYAHQQYERYRQAQQDARSGKIEPFSLNHSKVVIFCFAIMFIGIVIHAFKTMQAMRYLRKDRQFSSEVAKKHSEAMREYDGLSDEEKFELLKDKLNSSVNSKG